MTPEKASGSNGFPPVSFLLSFDVFAMGDGQLILCYRFARQSISM
jgi:hypothetical protein